MGQPRVCPDERRLATPDRPGAYDPPGPRQAQKVLPGDRELADLDPSVIPVVPPTSPSMDADGETEIAADGGCDLSPCHRPVEGA